MLAKNFIFEKLTALAQAFPNILIKYVFNKLAKTHIIELSPLEYYYNNPALDDAWIHISKEFYEQFPSEDISFISVDSSLKIREPEFLLNNNSAKFYLRPIHFSNLQEAVSEVFEEWSTKINWENLSIPSDISFQHRQEPRFTSTNNYAFSSKPLIDNSSLNNITLNNIIITNLNISNPTIAVDDKSYAMAA